MEEYTTPNPPDPYPTGKKEMIFCVLMLFIGLSMANFILMGSFNLGFAITSVASILCAAGYLYSRGHKGSWYTRSILMLCLILAAGFAWSDDSFVKFVLFFFLIIGVNLALCISTGQNLRNPGSVRSLLDAPRALFVMGIGKWTLSCRGIVGFFRTGSEASRRTGAILAGLALALPLLGIMIPLLMGADAAFEGLMDQLPELDLPEIIHTLFWGCGIFLILYTRAVALHHHRQESPSQKQRKGLHLFTINTVLGTICSLYLVYLVSQIAYFSGGFLGILPDGYSAAQYARRGFFEMAWLCAINLGIITFGIGLVSRTGKAPLSTRLLCLSIGLVTLFLVCASCAKMALYIDTYGLTRLRVLTMAIIIFLALTTVLVSLWLFLPRLQYMKAILLIALVIGASILWMDVDTQVARYNVHAYLSGRLSQIDTRHLGSLGNGALPYVIELTNADDPEVSQIAKDLQNNWHFRTSYDFRGWNYINAKAAGITNPNMEASRR